MSTQYDELLDKLALHDLKSVNDTHDISVMKVRDGWIYWKLRGDAGGVFVPQSNRDKNAISR